MLRGSEVDVVSGYKVDEKRDNLVECVHGGLLGVAHADTSIFFDGPVEGVTFKAHAVAEHAVATVVDVLDREGLVLVSALQLQAYESLNAAIGRLDRAGLIPDE